MFFLPFCNFSLNHHKTNGSNVLNLKLKKNLKFFFIPILLVAVKIIFGSENGLLKSKLLVFFTLKTCFRYSDFFCGDGVGTFHIHSEINASAH